MNAPSFTKAVDNPFLACACVDFAFQMSKSAAEDATDRMMADAVTGDAVTGAGVTGDGQARLAPVDFFIHICCHLYKEATSFLAQEIAQDFNLIKFVDVARYRARHAADLTPDAVWARAEAFGVAGEVAEVLALTAKVLDIRFPGYGIGATQGAIGRMRLRDGREIRRSDDEIIGVMAAV